MSSTSKSSIESKIQTYLFRAYQSLHSFPVASVQRAVELIIESYDESRQVFIIGNGGSASTASHIANDLGKGVLVSKGKSFSVHCLADNVSTLTAWANDFCYDEAYVNLLRTYADQDDLLIAVSGSGNSVNILQAARWAKDHMKSIGLIGMGGGKLKDLVDVPVIVEGYKYGNIEDAHLMINHIFCECLL